MLWTSEKQFANAPFETEADLENAVVQLAPFIFGPDRIFLTPKKLIGKKGKTQNIPDGYLIDLSSKKNPRLFVVEVELAVHEPLKHIAVQILQFSLSFDSSRRVKTILRESLDAAKEARAQCERYAASYGFENLDYLLEKMVQGDGAFNALIIIDELDDELETVLLRRFKFPVEILTLRRFRAADGQPAYQFDPFLADAAERLPDSVAVKGISSGPSDPDGVDTIVVPAQEDGFKEVFLGENRWHRIRIHSSMLRQIKHIAVYQVAPVSAITYIAPVKNIELWPDSSKYVLNFTEPARPIGPIRLVPGGKTKALQGPRYTSLRTLQKARTLDEAFEI